MVGLSVSGSISLPLGFLLQLSLSVLYTIAIHLYSALAFADCLYLIISNLAVDLVPILLILAFIFSLFTTKRVLF